MLRRLLKKNLPQPQTIKSHKSLKWLAPILHHPYLWHINRHTIARGFAAGLFVAFIPLPVQMLAAAWLAFMIRGNLLIAVLATWISNPITFVPINYIIYRIGRIFTTNDTLYPAKVELSEQIQNWQTLFIHFTDWFANLGTTYLIGLLLTSIIAAVIGYLGVNLVWRLIILVHIYNKKTKVKKHK